MFKFILFICDINQLLSFLIEFSPFTYLKVLCLFTHVGHLLILNIHWTWLVISKWFYINISTLNLNFYFWMKLYLISKGLFFENPLSFSFKKEQQKHKALEFKVSFFKKKKSNRIILCVCKMLANVCEPNTQLGRVYALSPCRLPLFLWSENPNAVWN